MKPIAARDKRFSNRARIRCQMKKETVTVQCPHCHRDITATAVEFGTKNSGELLKCFIEQMRDELHRLDKGFDVVRRMGESSAKVAGPYGPMNQIKPRTARAAGSKAGYRIQQVGAELYYVRHPQEDEQAHVVDLGLQTCECPDFECRMRGVGGPCSHLLAAAELWEEQTGEVFEWKEEPTAEPEVQIIDPTRELVNVRFDENGRRYAARPEDFREIDPFGNH